MNEEKQAVHVIFADDPRLFKLLDHTTLQVTTKMPAVSVLETSLKKVFKEKDGTTKLRFANGDVLTLTNIERIRVVAPAKRYVWEIKIPIPKVHTIVIDGVKIVGSTSAKMWKKLFGKKPETFTTVDQVKPATGEGIDDAALATS